MCDCPICFKVIRNGSPVTITKCNHSFHEVCLETWLQYAGTCPMCRGTLIDRPYSPTSVLDMVNFEPLPDSDIIGLYLPNYDLGQRLDYGDI